MVRLVSDKNRINKELDLTNKTPICPECGNTVIFSTGKEYYGGKDLNYMWCENCGYSARAFEWKTYIKRWKVNNGRTS